MTPRQPPDPSRTRLQPDDGAENQTRPQAEAGATSLQPPGVPTDPALPYQRLNLPPAIAADYRYVRDLPSGGEANLILVCLKSASDDDDAALRVAKIYNRALGVSEELMEALHAADRDHVVRLERWGTERETTWELLEYCPAGSLRDLIDKTTEEADRLDLATKSFEEIAAALAHFHEQVGAHRDLKPENVLVRSSSDPFDLVLADFGLIRRLDASVVWAKSAIAVGSYAYMAPEILSGGQVSVKVDWWSLGMITAEIALGHHPLAAPDGSALGELQLRSEIAGGQIDLEKIADERLRLACSGLLIRDPRLRWGAEQIAAFNRGESPAVATEAPPRTTRQTRITPLPFTDAQTGDERQFNDPSALARAMASRWDEAAELIEGRDRRAQMALRDFLSSAGLSGWEQVLSASIEPEAKLVRLLLVMDPDIPPTFRGLALDREGLLALTRQASENPDRAADLAAIQEFRVLRQYSTPDGERSDYAELESRWDRECAELETRLAATGALDRADIDALLPRAKARLLEALLDSKARASIKEEGARAVADEEAGEQQWFKELCGYPGASIAGDLLPAMMVEEAAGRTRAEKEKAAARDRDRRLEAELARIPELPRPPEPQPPAEHHSREYSWDAAIGTAFWGIPVCLIWVGNWISDKTAFDSGFPLGPMLILPVLVGGLVGFWPYVKALPSEQRYQAQLQSHRDAIAAADRRRAEREAVSARFRDESS